jgi:hypothetical protein
VATAVTALVAVVTAAVIALMLMQWPELQHMKYFSTQNDLAYPPSMLSINEIVFRAQCYKSFYIRNLRIFVLS